jgi:hypothetical protein
MSIRTMDRVWKSSRQSGGKLLLLLAIADFANDNGMAYPGIETLAEKTRQSRRTVQRQLAELEISQDLAIEPGTGRSNTNTYWVLAGLDPNVKRKLIEGAQKAKGDKMTLFIKNKKGDTSDVKGDICETKRVTSATKRVTSTTLKGDIAMTPEPSLTVIKQKKENRYQPGIDPDPAKAFLWLLNLWIAEGKTGKSVYSRLSLCLSAEGEGGELLIIPNSEEDAIWLESHALQTFQRQMAGNSMYQKIRIIAPAMVEVEQ